MAAALVIAIGGLAAIVATSDGQNRRVVPGASTSTTDPSQEARDRAEAERRQQEAEAERRQQEAAAAAAQAEALAKEAAEDLARQVAAAVAEVGWSVTLPADLVSQTAQLADSRGVANAEVRLRDGDVGELFVSILTGDAAAVEAARNDHGQELQAAGTASVYLVVDGPDARAVQLVDGMTIITVRSDSSTGSARSIPDLTQLAFAFNRIRT